MRILSIAKEGIYIEKKSKFICHLFKVEDFDAATEKINLEKKKYFDAKHHCTAIVLGENGDVCRCSDDGEPSGTAGRPMLEILKHENLTNICCVVTRYFGGTLLGTGGLVRAYSEALKDAINNSTFAQEIDSLILKYKYPYTLEAKISRFFRDNDIVIENVEYSDAVTCEIVIPADSVSVKDKLIDLTNNNIELLDEKSCKYLVDCKE
ncbi:MAG: YigZ family protein [Lachnospiraceae bacterium]|nr:YigZ family protein [Lachnospiraceae bacterium]